MLVEAKIHAVAEAGGQDTLAASQQIRHRAIALAFYACMTVVTLQLAITAAEIWWGGSQGGQLPSQITLFATLASIPWIANLLAVSLRTTDANLAWVRTETVFSMSLVATFAGTYNLGFNVQIGAFGIYCGVIGTLRAGQLSGNLRVMSLLVAALAAIFTRPGGWGDAQLMSATAVSDSLAWNLFAPFIQPYALGVVINFAIDFLMKSYQTNREQLADAYREISARWERDPLTGLFSRGTLEAKFEAINETTEPDNARLAVALIDLDNFKSINTFCGHGAGDKALTAFAERLKQLLPEAELFRLGGDEFLALQLITDDAKPFVEQLEATASPLKIAYQNDELNLSASVGLTLATRPCEYHTVASEADIAMRQAKRKGKGSVVRFAAGDSVPSASNAARPAMAVSPLTSSASKTEVPAREVGAAILSDQIGYAVQPFFDTKTQRICGAECLLRWRLDDGSIVPIDHYLNTFIVLEWQAPYMDHLLKKRTQLYSSIRARQPIDVHFNYAAESLRSDAFASHVIEPLQQKPVNLQGFVIEISEKGSKQCGSIIEERHLTVLRNAGVKIAIDDFGVGHSNLERLANVDADVVKLDKQFVAEGLRSKRGRDILCHTKQLTDAMNVDLIAEGVETIEQEQMLKDSGITEHQGFLRGRPQRPETFLARLQQFSLTEQLAV